MHILSTILDDELQDKWFERAIIAALDAGLVSDWLVNYPLCMETDTGAAIMQRKRETILNLTRDPFYDKSYPRQLCYILHLLITDDNGREEMVRYGLWEWLPEHEDSDTGQRRRVEESPEEMQLRRRRREAMVLGEEGREIRRSDIFERADDVRDEDVEEELEELLVEVAEAEAEVEAEA